MTDKGNDDRSRKKNPENAEYEADRINRERQKHPNVPPPADQVAPKQEPKK